ADEEGMTTNEIARVQDYLRRTFANDRIAIDPPVKRGAPERAPRPAEPSVPRAKNEPKAEAPVAVQAPALAEGTAPPARPSKGGKGGKAQGG
ncbi:MAG: hypothetical protein ACRDLD_11810, partial [Thermoleophilaceae bacterium]